jgi:transcriptional regulator with GAF, ATPase, and Fis domain
MLSINSYERLSKEYVALTEISKSLASPLELAELLDAVMKKIVTALEQAEVGSIMLCDQSAGLFQPAATVELDLEVMKEMGVIRTGEAITEKAFDKGYSAMLQLKVLNRDFYGWGKRQGCHIFLIQSIKDRMAPDLDGGGIS